MKRKFLILMIAVLLAGCSTCQTFYQNFVDRINTTRLHYQCDEQPLAVALNKQKQEVTFRLNNESLNLKQGLSASGTRYSDGIYVFWSKGDTATVYRQDRVALHNCRLITGH